MSESPRTPTRRTVRLDCRCEIADNATYEAYQYKLGQHAPCPFHPGAHVVVEVMTERPV